MAQTNANAQGADFFGEGTTTGAQSPITPEEAEELRRRAAANQAAASGKDRYYDPTAYDSPAYRQASRDDFAANYRKPDSNTFLDAASDLWNNPVVNPIGYAGSKVGGAVDRALGTSVSGWAQDPAGQALADLGAPDAVQLVANPTGFAARRAVNPGTGFGTNVPQIMQNGVSAVKNVNNDVQNASDAVGGIGVPNLKDIMGDPAAGLDQYAQRAQGLGAGARSALAPVTSQRNTQAQNMYAQGAAAQNRGAASTGYVDYGNAQSINAPTLAAARQAATGNFGAQQSVRAANVGPAAQAVAQQANAENARNIADLDFAQANESRAAMGESVNRIRGYVDQGPGESQAQIQLRMAQEQNLGDALSLARSGRGNAAGNMKMALSENAATNAQTNQQAALLRANEADLWRGRQLQGLGLEQQGTTAMRGQDITAAAAQGQHAVSREQIASNVDVSNAQLGTQVSLGNAEQQNMGTRLQAQLSTEAAIQQANLANARNIAVGNAGTQVSLGNAEQANLTSRLQGQLQSDAAIQQASLANALNIAKGNSSTTINQANLDAQVRQREANDAMQRSMTGYGLDSQRMGQDALTYGLGLERDYSQQASELAAEMAKARSIRQAALIGGGASLIEELIPG